MADITESLEILKAVKKDKQKEIHKWSEHIEKETIANIKEEIEGITKAINKLESVEPTNKIKDLMNDAIEYKAHFKRIGLNVCEHTSNGMVEAYKKCIKILEQ